MSVIKSTPLVSRNNRSNRGTQSESESRRQESRWTSLVVFLERFDSGRRLISSQDADFCSRIEDTPSSSRENGKVVHVFPTTGLEHLIVLVDQTCDVLLVWCSGTLLSLRHLSGSSSGNVCWTHPGPVEGSF